MGTIWTFGHSNRSLEEFLELISRSGIQCVVDVGSFTTSKWEYFKKDVLFSALEKASVRYFWFGDGLGFRKGGYVNWMNAPSFAKGLTDLLQLARKERVAIMCSEKFPWKYRRNFLSRRLAAEKLRVVRILDFERSYEQKSYWRT